MSDTKTVVAYPCPTCGAESIDSPIAQARQCTQCKRVAHETLFWFPIVAWATRVAEDRAELFGDNDRDWLHA